MNKKTVVSSQWAVGVE